MMSTRIQPAQLAGNTRHRRYSMLIFALLLVPVIGATAQDSTRAAARREMEPIQVANEFLAANSDRRAAYAINTFRPDAVVTFDVPAELAAGGPSDGFILTTPDLQLWIMDHLVGSEIEIFVTNTCQAGDVIVMDALWGRRGDHFPVRLEFLTEAGYITSLRVSEQTESSTCEE